VRTASTIRCSTSGGLAGLPSRAKPGRASTPVTATKGIRPRNTHRHPKTWATAALASGPTIPGATHAVESTAIIRARSRSGKARPMAT
jgi:hypothetical protein